jgi:hypothetical protein
MQYQAYVTTSIVGEALMALRVDNSGVVPLQPVTARCELCGTPLGAEHEHLFNLDSRELAAACEGCAAVFSDPRNLQYRRVPREIQRLDNFQMTDEIWQSLQIPTGLAMIFHHAQSNRALLIYPGATSSDQLRVPTHIWRELVMLNPPLAQMQSDVEALLIHRIGGEQDYFIVPIDIWHKLQRLIRTHWRGVSGGPRVWREIGQFFAALRGPLLQN